jgi:hypothetical protein
VAADRDGSPVTPLPPDDGFPAFALGIEYAELGLAEAYAGTGATWAKTRLEAFAWGRIEPEPPVAGVHTHDWALTDAMVREYQGAGFLDIQSYLQPLSPWGSVSDAPLDNDPAPRPEHLDDYRAWVGALIERYDGDGHADMPGLLAPVRYWVVGGEWTGFWGSADAEGYLATLEATAEEAQAAYPEVRLGAIPFYLWDVFEGNEPSEAQIAERLADPNPIGRNPAAGIEVILDHPGLFDFVNVHSLGDYTEIAPLLRWLRAEMAERGYERPIWIDDAFPASFLANVTWPAFYPVTAENRQAVLDLLLDVARLEEPAHTEAAAWLYAYTASGAVKKVVTAVGEGAAGINLGNTEDWMHDSIASVRTFQVNLIGAAASMGMVEVSHPAGYQVDDTRVAGAPRPAWHAVGLLADRLGDGRFERVEAVGGLTGPRGYRFERGGAVMWVLWVEAGLVLPGEAEPSAAFELAVGPGTNELRLTHVITGQGESVPRMEVVAVSGETATVVLTTVPVIIAE